MTFKKSLLAVISIAAITTSSQAEENLWVYAKGTDTRPEGSYELKLSDTIRIGKGSGQYIFHDIRPEIEYGVTDRLTIGAEVMIFDHSYALNKDIGPMKETQADEHNGKFNKTQYGGYELALKYNILSPYKDPFGFSIGFAFEDRDRYRLDGAKIDQKSYVNNIFLQKNWIDNRLTLVFNLKSEFERRKSGADQVLEEELAFDGSLAIAYRFIPKHFLGFEIRTQSDYLSPIDGGAEDDPKLDQSNLDLSDIRIGTRHQIAWYAGPSYHYAQKDWWATAGILFQFAGDGSEHAYVENSKNWDEHEKIHIGLSYGYNF